MSFTSDKNELRRILNSHKIGESKQKEIAAINMVEAEIEKWNN